MSGPPPQRIAERTRALTSELATRVSVHADAFAQSLAQGLGLVSWDREQLVGQLQERLARLGQHGHSVHGRGSTGVRVVERVSQPLEAIDLAWGQLLEGRQVHFDHERGACTAGLDLMRGMSRLLRDAVGHPVLEVNATPLGACKQRDIREAESPWPCVGPHTPGPRIAVIGEDADRELAAYVLARASLRRAGVDVRAIKHAYVIGSWERLQRHLQRLWLGSRMGPAADSQAFAGPVDRHTHDAFHRAGEAWAARSDVRVWCEGGSLLRPEDDGLYLAPALFFVEGIPAELPTAGPMLIVSSCTGEQARQQAMAIVRDRGQITAVGRVPQLRDTPLAQATTHIRGALLVERLPPGLPEPRPA